MVLELAYVPAPGCVVSRQAARRPSSTTETVRYRSVVEEVALRPSRLGGWGGRSATVSTWV